jgi:hypothetical protein
MVASAAGKAMTLPHWRSQFLGKEKTRQLLNNRTQW